MESLEVVLLKFLTVDLVLSIPLLQKNLVHLIDLLQEEFVRSAVRPMELADKNSTGPSWPIGLGASALFAYNPPAIVVLLDGL
jgi:hypothetical protein